jgi:lipoyl(octanoyl) transferase
VNLRDWGGPIKYVRTLEQIIIKSLADFGIEAGLIEGLTGVWAGDAKIAAIGVKISRGVAYHGFAINVNTDLSYFDHIIPCGITDRKVTSMACLLGELVDPEAAQYSVAYQFGRGMGFRTVESEEGEVREIIFSKNT